eukprot:9237358-Pyramimonas_sp.AAC.1
MRIFHLSIANSKPALKSVGLMTSPCLTPRWMRKACAPDALPICPEYSLASKAVQSSSRPWRRRALKRGPCSIRSNAL